MKKLVLQEACPGRRLAGMRRFICAAILMLGTAGMAMAQEDETDSTDEEDSTSGLQKGIYIINGKKITIK